MSFKDSTAAELATQLEGLAFYEPNTGMASMLDEATIAFGRKSADLADAQRAFSSARSAHMRSYRTEVGDYSADAWAQVIQAAYRLAALLRPLGETRIARCKEKTGWGTCNLPLDDDGQCGEWGRGQHVSAANATQER